MKQLLKYFPLTITTTVIAVLLLSYQKHELRNLLSINDLNKKLRVLQSTSRKSLVDNELAEQLVEEKKYVSK
jgi:UDP-N-acetylglucosamine enolpyruvyl transferase